VSDIEEALIELERAYDALGIAYQVVGSIASSVVGVGRTTLDIDMVANVQIEHIDSLVSKLKGIYYVDAELIAEAIDRRASFNIIHLDTMLKIDVFVLGSREYDRVSLGRSRQRVLEHLAFWVSSPEDVVLAKLEWFEAGERSSQRQWADVLGVLRVQAQQLDLVYMRHWASVIGVLPLLEQAFAEAELEP
jgi:hypothetical protein